MTFGSRQIDELRGEAIYPEVDPPERIDRCRETELEAPNPHTLADPKAINKRIGQAASDGCPWWTDEWKVGITSVAAPILTPSGRLVAALGIYGPTYRFPGTHDPAAIGRRVVEVGRHIGDHLEDT
ncbi:MAG: hypothetical protein GY720_15365 [bacterium]|nr:hypothetical protein [bacterium]